jgi:hypothetical protein
VHLECNGEDKTGVIAIPNTGGYQKWQVLKKKMRLDAGKNLLKLVVDGDGVNLDKMVVEEIRQ